MVNDTTQPDIDLDLRELRCPHVLVATIKAIEKMKSDQLLRITASDLNAPSSISSWTRQSGHKLLDMYQEDDQFIILIQRQPETMSLSTES